jgi:hypothetical protein
MPGSLTLAASPKKSRSVMITVNKHLIALVLALAVAGLASSSFAQASEYHVSAARAAALRYCNAQADRYYYERTTTQISTYRACMFQHGEQE